MKQKKMMGMVLSVVMSISLLAGCGASGTEDGANTGKKETEQNGSGSGGQEDSGVDGEKDILDITVVIKGQDSEFWQTVGKGAEAAAEELKGKANVSIQGASESADFDGQLSLLENILSTDPDAIVLGPASTSGVVGTVDTAMEKGIKVTIVDTAIESDNYDSFISTDNYEAGQMAADAMVEKLQADNKELKGTVGIISPISGVKSLSDRENGFADRIKEIAPDIELLPTVYVDGDAAKALSSTQDMYLANKETLLGIFGNADLTAGGIVSAMAESSLQGEFVVTAIDASKAEIEGLENESIYALVVQDPFDMGYQGVMNSYRMLMGESVDKDIASSTAVVTKSTMDEEANHKLLYPLE